MTSVEATLLVTGTDVLIGINQNVLGLVPLNACVVGKNGNVDFVKDFLVTGESSITPSGNGAVLHVASIVWWWHVVGETDGPDVFVEFDILGGLEDADIVDNLPRGDLVVLVASDRLQQVSLLVGALLDLVVGTDNDFIGGWGLVPADETMGSGQNIA